MSRLPLIGIPADRRLLGSITSTWSARSTSKPSPPERMRCRCSCLLSGPSSIWPSLLDACDGLLLTGSASNVEPHHYGGPASAPGTLHDPNRDATTLPLIPQAVAAGLPVLAICRGFQEMNVAYGGTLYQRLHEVAGLSRSPRRRILPLDVQYGPAHEVLLEPGGTAAKNRRRDRLQVNSLHWQGIADAGHAILRSRRARRTASSRRFALPMRRASRSAVQWHPEWQFAMNPFSRALFAAFGEASRRRAAGSR